jgi:hypothetical protein
MVGRPDREATARHDDDEPVSVRVSASDAALPRIVLVVLAAEDEEVAAIEGEDQVGIRVAELDVGDRLALQAVEETDLLVLVGRGEVGFVNGEDERSCWEERPAGLQVDVDLPERPRWRWSSTRSWGTGSRRTPLMPAFSGRWRRTAVPSCLSVSLTVCS